jgi:hypothetical protein
MSADDAGSLRLLLALCVRPADCDLPADAVEWDQVLRLALAHGVAPLLFANLRERVLPVRARDSLRLVYLANSFRNEKLLAEQQRILDAFSKKSISVWPLKGPHLSKQLFGDLAVRQVADLDLLIQPHDLRASDAVLQAFGYTRQVMGDITALHDAGELLYLKLLEDSNARTVGGQKERSYFAVDLQQRVLPYGRRDPLADRIRAQGFTPENLLLLLCVNQVTHRFSKLKYLLDVAACLRQLPENFDWDCFLTAAQHLDFTPGIYWSLAWARDAAGAPVPEHVLEELCPSWSSRRLASRALGKDVLAVLARGAALDGPAGAWAILACTRGGLPRFRVLWTLLFPPAAYLFQEFSAPANSFALPLYVRRLWEKLPAALRRHS